MAKNDEYPDSQRRKNYCLKKKAKRAFLTLFHAKSAILYQIADVIIIVSAHGMEVVKIITQKFAKVNKKI